MKMSKSLIVIYLVIFGWLSLVFAGDKLYLEEQITEVIQDGLDYLKYKNDYLGSKISDSHV